LLWAKAGLQAFGQSWQESQELIRFRPAQLLELKS
jgi:hypothetical protein